MTYGEAWMRAKEESQSLERKFDDYAKVGDFKHKPRMQRREASLYYTNKINKEFERLGYKIKELTVRDFDSVDDYFGYFEAQKIMESLKCA